MHHVLLKDSLDLDLRRVNLASISGLSLIPEIWYRRYWTIYKSSAELKKGWFNYYNHRYVMYNLMMVIPKRMENKSVINIIEYRPRMFGGMLTQ